MSAEPPTEADHPAPLRVRPEAVETAVLDGGRRTVVVSPDEVWSAPEPLVTTPEEIQREARQSFLAPIWTVVGLSTALLLLFMAALALLVWLRR